MNRLSRLTLAPLPALLLMAVLSAPSVVAQEIANPPARKIYAPTGTEGAITGTINFRGAAPARRVFDMSADPVCAQANRNLLVDDIVVRNGKLANTVVYVKSGEVLETHGFAAPSSEAMLQHKQCRYVPHVLGIQTGQTLKIFNSDQTVHNTNVQSKSNEKWNLSQTPDSAPLVRQFSRREMFIPFKDNQHPWEKAYVFVFDHPYFAVSGRDGSFRIENLPPGVYIVAAWHEKLGEQEMKVTIAPNEERALDFTFQGPQQEER